jgi:pimeloyl-ACP methyl ester carboxylesterase
MQLAGRIHAVQQGEGPLVLLIHGFPDGWSSWRRQLPALAAAGHRAVAIDVRGYGGSFAPPAVEDYRMVLHVADAVAAVHALGETTATVIGHDWGSGIAAACALMRPDVFTAVGLLGVPYTPRGDAPPTSLFPEDFYVSRFQQPGAEAELEADIPAWLRGFYASTDGLEPDAPLPAWRSGFDERVAEFERHGLRGPLNRYRNMDRDWEDLSAFDGATIEQPAIYIAGARDPSVRWLAEAIEHQSSWLPGLTGTHLLEGAGHWVHEERPGEVNALLVDWLRALR